MRTPFLVLVTLLAVATQGADPHVPAPHAPAVPAVAPAVDVLSTHRTDAVYEGVRHLPCLHRTALCPDKCGHARDVAVFRITSYREYVAGNPHHGDPKAAEFLMPLKEGDEVSSETLAFAKGLQVGDAVKLEWVHEYVRSQGASYPRRRVTQLAR